MVYLTVLGHFFRDFNNFLGIWSWETIFGVDKHLIKVPQKMCQKFLPDPQKPPKSAEISTTVSDFGPKNPDEILLSKPFRSQNGLKNTRWGLKMLFNT